MKVETIYFEDYAIGTTRETMGRTITETDIVIHAGQTGDFFPHHMDKEWVKTQEFERRIAHGTLILSIGVGMTAEDINPAAFSYGYDRVRFIRPSLHRRHGSRARHHQREARPSQARGPRFPGRIGRGLQPGRGHGAGLRAPVYGAAQVRHFG